MNKKVIAIVAAVVLVLMVGAGLAVPLRDDGADDPNEESTTTTTLPFEPESGTVYAYRQLYVPDDRTIEVAVGDTLTFENRDAVDHTFTSDEGLYDSGAVAPDDDYGYSYTDPGTYGVHCEIHPTMRISVEVTEAPKS